MSERTKKRAVEIAGWSAFGAVATAVAGGTPVGVAMVAGLGGALAWRLPARSAAARQG